MESIQARSNPHLGVEEGDSQEVVAFRVFRELLTNIVEQDEASNIDVKLTSKNNILTLDVIDNGAGSSNKNKTKKEQSDILAMEERIRLIGGSLDVSVEKSGGTRISLLLPLKQEGSK